MFSFSPSWVVIKLICKSEDVPCHTWLWTSGSVTPVRPSTCRVLLVYLSASSRHLCYCWHTNWWATCRTHSGNTGKQGCVRQTEAAARASWPLAGCRAGTGKGHGMPAALAASCYCCCHHCCGGWWWWCSCCWHCNYCWCFFLLMPVQLLQLLLLLVWLQRLLI